MFPVFLVSVMNYINVPSPRHYSRCGSFFLKKYIKIPHLIVKVWTLVVVAPGHIFIFVFVS